MEHFDARDACDPLERERILFAKLPDFLARSIAAAPGLAGRLAGIDPAAVTSRKALAGVPVLRKDELMARQAQDPPFGGFADPALLRGARLFMSPGPILEPQPPGIDPWAAARALHAAGFRPGDIVHNAFAYHMTPGGFILDEGARALGCSVFPAGAGNTDAQVEAAALFGPTGFTGTPDFLKIILDRAAETGRPLDCFRRALVSGGALFPSLREEYRQRGIAVLQCYATAELGVVAYETRDPEGLPLPGMVVNEDIIVEIVRPGTDSPVPDGEVGEIVVTTFNPAYTMLRLGTGDLSATLPGASPCGRTGTRIRGWLGRADQRTKVKGMFVDPRQVAAIVARHPDITRARLLVERQGEADAMTLEVEMRPGAIPELTAIAATLRDVTRLGGAVRVAGPEGLPNDGKVIADLRDYRA